jgi:hypothetical protein
LELWYVSIPVISGFKIATWPLTIPVVLLDEADVFLEQRSFANLERNALVSGELDNGRHVLSSIYIADNLQSFSV